MFLLVLHLILCKLKFEICTTAQKLKEEIENIKMKFKTKDQMSLPFKDGSKWISLASLTRKKQEGFSLTRDEQKASIPKAI